MRFHKNVNPILLRFRSAEQLCYVRVRCRRLIKTLEGTEADYLDFPNGIIIALVSIGDSLHKRVRFKTSIVHTHTHTQTYIYIYIYIYIDILIHECNSLCDSHVTDQPEIRDESLLSGTCPHNLRIEPRPRPRPRPRLTRWATGCDLISLSLMNLLHVMFLLLWHSL